MTKAVAGRMIHQHDAEHWPAWRAFNRHTARASDAVGLRRTEPLLPPDPEPR